MTLGEKIHHYRKQLSLSQEELAERIGVSRQAVSKWETNDALPEVDKLLTLARTFAVTTDELLSPEAPKEQTSSTHTAPPPPSSPFRNTVDFSAIGRFFRQWGFLVGIPISAYGVYYLFTGFILAATGGNISKVTPADSTAELLQTVGIILLVAGFALLIGGAALAKHLWEKRKSAVSKENQTEEQSPEE